MPLLSFIKNLVGTSDEPAQQQQQQQIQGDKNKHKGTETPVTHISANTDKAPVPPPPPMDAGQTKPGGVERSLEVSRTESTVSVYKDFTGTGHADRGHWNDPPPAVFKQTGTPTGFTMVDGAVTPNGTLVAETQTDDIGEMMPEERVGREEMVRRVVKETLEQVEQRSAGDAERVVNDTRKRLDVLVDGRLEAVDDYLVAQLCRLCALLECKRHGDALGVHREIVRTPGYDAESRWLVGIKRLGAALLGALGVEIRLERVDGYGDAQHSGQKRRTKSVHVVKWGSE
ncbi:hypothetical protein LPJ64_004519 [Coemansia asiatica]|uniref:Uncharacterized protein n=1 Tax=Coemansia asiatica TaxID=1052880 RepID=A0A9W8CIZ0_9FUNG|nr:hypothetical protein LPJ64_004519 [Coemansia asiatica]